MIDKISAQNFKAFQTQELSLRGLTLFTGLNGSGKSSALQILLLLRQSFDAGAFLFNRLNLNGVYAHLGTAQDVLNESASEDQVRFEIRMTDVVYDWSLRFERTSDRTAEAIAPQALDRTSGLFGEGFVFLAADRISPQIFYSVPDVAHKGVTSVGIHGEWTAHFLSELGSKNIAVENCAHPAARSHLLTHQVEAWMGEISPGVRINLDARNDLDLVGVTYSFVARRDVSAQYRPTNVGFGVTYVLPVITAVLAAKPGDLIIVESPEAHVHPKGQTKLAELMARAARAGVQILVESHSDHILNGLRVCVHDGLMNTEDLKILYFRWDVEAEKFGTTVTEIDVDRDGRIAEWPEGFFDEFDKSLEALLRPIG